jgi:hypothetical protein
VLMMICNLKGSLFAPFNTCRLFSWGLFLNYPRRKLCLS